jgi:hypothetical protein
MWTVDVIAPKSGSVRHMGWVQQQLYDAYRWPPIIQAANRTDVLLRAGVVTPPAIISTGRGGDKEETLLPVKFFGTRPTLPTRPMEDKLLSVPIMFRARESLFASSEEKKIPWLLYGAIALVVVGGGAYMLTRRKTPAVAPNTPAYHKCMRGERLARA